MPELKEHTKLTLVRKWMPVVIDEQGGVRFAEYFSVLDHLRTPVIQPDGAAKMEHLKFCPVCQFIHPSNLCSNGSSL